MPADRHVEYLLADLAGLELVELDGLDVEGIGEAVVLEHGLREDGQLREVPYRHRQHRLARHAVPRRVVPPDSAGLLGRALALFRVKVRLCCVPGIFEAPSSTTLTRCFNGCHYKQRLPFVHIMVKFV
jgi:hypothetical protein